MADISQKQLVRVQVRWLIGRDMPEVLAIELQSFEFPWFKEDFLNYLEKPNRIGIVAEHDELVVGFALYERHKTLVKIHDFAVAKAFRRCGVGTKIVERLIKKFASQGKNRITLEVRETNLPAQLFFKAMGFRAVNVFRNFYAETLEDAYLMHYRCKP